MTSKTLIRASYYDIFDRNQDSERLHPPPFAPPFHAHPFATPFFFIPLEWKRYERENHVTKSQGIYLESGLIEA